MCLSRANTPTNDSEKSFLSYFSCVFHKTFYTTKEKNYKEENSQVILITQNNDYLESPLYDLVINTHSTLDYSSNHLPFSVLCSVISLACYQTKTALT